jgi:Xaa-Pro dipeptidase
VQGYAADITRTVAFGTPSAEAVRVFEVVREAQRRALRAARPGKRAGEIDTVARDYITAQGFGPGYKLFTHRLGHGIGLEGHEWPYLVKGSDVVLRPGMTFSDEPGIYQYGKFGVRLEDIMVITESGADLLTPQASSLAITDI